jgi:hypoxanthine phosphoribosyltransferase
MGVNTDSFECKIAEWNQLQRTAESVTRDVINSDFSPTAVVGVARGGWIPARCVADFLEIDNLTSIKIDHYQGTKEKQNAEIQFNTRLDAIQGEKVLVVDDIVDTGKTLSEAIKDIQDSGAEKTKSCTLHSLPKSDIKPDFVGKRFEDFYWIIYPWNITEDFNEIIRNVLKDTDGKVNEDELIYRLGMYHSIQASDFEAAGYSVADLLSILDDRDEINYKNQNITLK